MRTDDLWQLIAQARATSEDPADADEVAELVTELLTELQPRAILAAHQALHELLAVSYRGEMRAAADLINGNVSDHRFDDFRGWLIAQGREVFDRVLATPDALADVPAVIHAAAVGATLECHALLRVTIRAYEEVTEKPFPADPPAPSYPDLDPYQESAHLPQLAGLFPSR